MLVALQVSAAAGADGGWRVASPAPVSPPLTIQAAAAVPGSDVIWLVGSEYPTAPEVFERRTGGRWVSFPAPATPVPVVLNGLSAAGPRDVWAVGFSEPASGDVQPVAEHWDGARWSVVPTPATAGNAVLRAVSARGRGDAWAVGWEGTRPLIEHWDGRAWRIVASPDVGDGSLGGVATIPGSTGVWAVGARAAAPPGSTVTLVERWDGRRWRVVPSPSYANGADGPVSGLTAVAALGPGEAWAVGSGLVPGNERLLLERWSGGRWSIVPGQPAGAEGTGIARVPRSRVLWVVGDRASGAETNEALSERVTPDGSTLVPTPSPDQGCEHENMLTTVAAGTDTVWAAGFVYHLANGCGDAVTGPLLLRRAAR